MRFRSKRYKKLADQADSKPLPLTEAVDKVKQWATAGFDQSVECVVQLGIDTRHAEQTVRGAVSLPHGIGKTLRVIAFCEGDDADQARAAGAVEAGADELVEKVQGGWLDFDVAVAHPRMMSKVGKLGRILGPQGKMPSPKSGTVTPEVVGAVKDYAAGKVEFRNDSGGNVHALVGKLSFDPPKLVENIEAFVGYIRRLKPSAAKGTYVKKICICATMSPSVQVDIS
ncbi:MAG: 50S ribosomal protein L1 [Phycisphaerae bacterium SM23_30]|nr:MAG: 50S ribosomal protein L1 [Phycisphaerae bacterium SM23_30]